MKKLVSCILVTALTLLAGCAAAPQPTVATVVPTEEAPKRIEAVTVSTVDEFLDALGSDREITLAPGTYDLTTAGDYAKSTSNPFYEWVESLDGHELLISGVNNLTIRGSGKDQTTILTRPRYSNVLHFQDSTDLRLEDFTAGHTETGQMCTGGVICLTNVSNASVRNAGLYGCGTIGVDAYNCFNTHVTNCDIYDCSFGGVQLNDCSCAAVENTAFHDIGTFANSAGGIFLIYDSDNITFRNCTVTDNLVYNLLDFSSVKDIRLENNLFQNNQAEHAGFHFLESSPIFVDNTFEGTPLRNWYTKDSSLAVDAEGKSMEESAFPAFEKPAESTAPQTQVTAATVDEFLAAIAPNTEIILSAELYDLSTAGNYGKDGSDYYRWEECFDGYELMIHNVDNLTIRTSGGDRKAHTIAAVPRYADILQFDTCRNVKISGFTAGHTLEPGYCTGGVIYYDNCDNMTIDNCGLFGCGILGVSAFNCSGINVLNSEIYECSYGGIQMNNVSDVTIDKTIFRDLGGDELMFQNCQNITVDGKPYSEK